MTNLRDKDRTAWEKAIRERWPMPSLVRRYKSCATFDLYYGPKSAADYEEEEFTEGFRWQGFGHACEQVRNWLEETLPSTLYFDADCDALMDKEPEGEEVDGEYFEPSEYYMLEWDDIVRAYCDKELVSYVR